MKIVNQSDLTRTSWFGAKRVVGSILSVPMVSFVARLVLKHSFFAQWRERLPVPCDRVYYNPTAGSPIVLLDSRRDLVAKDIHWGGGRPADPREAVKLRCIETLAKEAAVFLDVGAYSGVCALIAARANAKLHAIAFDIVPENYVLLIRNIIENDLIGTVEARLNGIGAQAGELRMPASLKVASLPTSVSLGSQVDGEVRIPVTTLDAETTHLKGPFLVKIDVEGFEHQVFEGASRFLASERPDIVCEILPDSLNAEAIEALLVPLGYRFYALTAKGIEPRTALRAEAGVMDWLIVARPQFEVAFAHMIKRA